MVSHNKKSIFHIFAYPLTVLKMPKVNTFPPITYDIDHLLLSKYSIHFNQ